MPPAGRRGGEAARASMCQQRLMRGALTRASLAELGKARVWKLLRTGLAKDFGSSGEE